MDCSFISFFIQHFNICQRLSIHTQLNLEYRPQEEMETSSWENGRGTVTKRRHLELEVLLFGRFPVLLVLPLPLARVLQIGEGKKIQLDESWYLLLAQQIQKTAHKNIPPPPCRWNLPSGSVASPPPGLLRTCFIILKGKALTFQLVATDRQSLADTREKWSYLAARTSSITSSSSGCMVTSTLSDFWFLRRSTCKRQPRRCVIESPKHAWNGNKCTLGARNVKAHPFNPSFILCPNHIPAKTARYKMSSPYDWNRNPSDIIDIKWVLRMVETEIHRKKHCRDD